MHNNLYAARRLGELNSEFVESPPIKVPNFPIFEHGFHIKLFISQTNENASEAWKFAHYMLPPGSWKRSSIRVGMRVVNRVIILIAYQGFYLLGGGCHVPNNPGIFSFDYHWLLKLIFSYLS